MILKLIKENKFFSIFLLVFILILAYKVTWFPTPFYDWDESLYIRSGLEMFDRNYFLFPVWQGQIWMDKPPLVPFIYALVSRIFFFIAAEISTRLFTVFIASIVLSFIYALYQKVLKDKLLSTLAVTIVALTPIFLQRTQVVNLDIFLLLGWLGYLLFFKNKKLSFLFLFIAVGSKSLIGFYAPAIMFGYHFYLLLRKKIEREKFVAAIKQIVVQSGLLLLWFILMTVLYGEPFFRQHIIESHFRRVTASIEFHFGERTYYINLARQQLGLFFYVSIVGFISVLIKFYNREKELLHSLYLLPWFAFLNLTKTKIFWYFFAAIPQFGFLSVFPITLLKKNKILYWMGVVAIIAILVYQSAIKENVLATVYSKPESYYQLSLFAKNECGQLYVLQDTATRSSFKELESLGLLISTTKWWGTHPSMVYYFDGKINFLYSEDEFTSAAPEMQIDDCLVVEETDKILITDDSYIPLKTFSSDTLFIKK